MKMLRSEALTACARGNVPDCMAASAALNGTRVRCWETGRHGVIIGCSRSGAISVQWSTQRGLDCDAPLNLQRFLVLPDR